MPIDVLDPTYEAAQDAPILAHRLASLDHKTVGIVSNGKQGTIPFFDALEQQLLERFGVARVYRVTKENYSAPAQASILEQAQEWDAVIAGIGD